MVQAIERSQEKAEKSLPAGWGLVRLGEHVTKIGSGITPRGGHATYLKSGIPLIRSQNVHMNRFEHQGLVYISSEQDSAMKPSRVSPGDVLLNITGASIGRVCVVPEDLCPANVNQHVTIIRSDGSFEPSFLAYYISIPEFQKYILDAEAGATRQALTKTLIENFKIPLPPLSEQKRIVTILNDRLSTVEKARAATVTQLEAAKALPAAYLNQVFRSSEAQEWKRKKLSDVCELLPAKSIASEGDTQVLAITTACLSETGFQPAGVKRARMWHQDAAVCKVSPGEVLIARSNTAELVGRVAMFSGEVEEAVASDLTIRIKTSGALKPEFLSLYLSSLYLQGYWKERAGGASDSMKKITRGQLVEELIPVPEIAEQQKISCFFTEKMLQAMAIQRSLQEQLDEIDKLPAALLRQAFNGEL